jgi:hypothetical protein
MIKRPIALMVGLYLESLKLCMGASLPPEEAKVYLTEAIQELSGPIPGAPSTLTDAYKQYFNNLLNNWDTVIDEDPSSFNVPELGKMQETFQFYYKNRTEITPDSGDSIVRPPMPLFLPIAPGGGAKKMIDFDNADWVVPGIKLRLAWIKLMAGQKMSDLLNRNANIVPVITYVNYIGQLEDKHALDALVYSDFHAILSSFQSIPDLSDEDVATLAKAHDARQSFGLKMGRYVFYSQFFHAMAGQKGKFVNDLWSARPDLFQPMVSSYLNEIMGKMDNFSKLISKFPNSSGKTELIAVYCKHLNAVLLQFNAIPVESYNSEHPSSSKETATPAEMRMVDQYVFNNGMGKSLNSLSQVEQQINSNAASADGLVRIANALTNSNPEADLVATCLRAYSKSASPDSVKMFSDFKKCIQKQQEFLFGMLPANK